MAIRCIDELDIREKKVFIRVDFNVPIDSEGRVADDTRIIASLNTIKWALGQRSKIILASHLGRPKGKVNPKHSLLPVAQRLQELLDREIIMAPDCVGDGVLKVISDLPAGGILFLENLRYHSEEESNDPGFSKELASLASVYINESFGTLNREYASTVGIVRFMEQSGMGFWVKRELEYLGRILQHPDHPFIAIVGGAKISDKIRFFEMLLERVDALLIGGAMAYTFLKAQGYSVGKSKVEERLIPFAMDLLDKSKERGVSIILPLDHVGALAADQNRTVQLIDEINIPDDLIGLDIGPKTQAFFAQQICCARTIFWNGPMGLFETNAFSQGTKFIAQEIAKTKSTSVIGGIDSVAAVHQVGVEDKITHISIGGGATLEFLEGIHLPGLKALEEHSS